MTLTLKAGRYYKTRDGTVVGPAKFHTKPPPGRSGTFPWQVGREFYLPDGRWHLLKQCARAEDLISEAPAPRKRRKAKGRREVIVCWCFAVGDGSIGYKNRKDAETYHAALMKSHQSIGAVRRIELPAPKGKK